MLNNLIELFDNDLMSLWSISFLIRRLVINREMLRIAPLSLNIIVNFWTKWVAVQRPAIDSFSISSRRPSPTKLSDVFVALRKSNFTPQRSIRCYHNTNNEIDLTKRFIKKLIFKYTICLR